MADYSNRPAELLKILEEKRQDATTKASAGGPAVQAATWSYFEQRLKEFIDWRDKVLVDGTPLVKAGTDATGQDVQSKWTSYFKDRGSEAFQKVQKFLNNPDATLQPWVETMCAQESTFFSMIADMPMASFQGDTRKDIKDLKEKKDVWVREWANFINMDQQRDNDWKKLKEVVMQESQKMVANLMGLHQQAEDFQEHVLPTIIEKAVGFGAGLIPGLDPQTAEMLGNATSEFLKRILDLVNMQKPSLEDYARQAQKLSFDRTTVLKMFAAKREDVQWVVKRYHPDQCVKRYEEVASKTRDLAGKAGSKDQVEDAKKLAEKIISESKSVVDDFKTCYDDFYKALDGTLVGRISDSTREQLAEAGWMQGFVDDFRKMDLYPGFQETTRDLAMVLDVNLDKLKEGSRKGVQDYLRMKFFPVIDKVKEISPSFMERLLNVLRDMKLGALSYVQ